MKHSAAVTRSLFICFLLVSASQIGCRSSTAKASETKTEPERSYQEYSDAVSNAEKAASKDEFDKFFITKAVISFSGNDIEHLSKLNVGKTGAIYVCDFDNRRISGYDSSGNNIKLIGKAGNEPGSHVFPTDAVEFNNSSVAVPDFSGHRVNIFSSDGSFKSSFIYTPQNFSAQRLVFNEANDSFYLFGNRWQTNMEGVTVGSDLMHKYSSSGEYLMSSLPFPEDYKALDLYNYSFPMTDVSGGAIYVVLPFDYTIYRVDANDNLSVFLKGNKNGFKPPSVKMDATKVPRPEAYKAAQAWELTWTPIVGLAVMGDDLLIQYQTFNPLRYTIDVWSTSSKKLKKTFSTDHLLLGRGQDNNFYFLTNLESKHQESYVITRVRTK